ncbi:MAG: DUF4381 domain-containing protein [Mariprofundaceae bacterium]|nr:DUF4381 domain-containing protein [Mariprofundaceae bacterium]
MNQDVLKQLKDIHLPAPEAWWHLPWGIGLLLGCLCLLAVFITWAWRPLKKRYHLRKSKQALQHAIKEELQGIEHQFQQTSDALTMLAAISILLRRVSMTVFEDEQVEGLIQSQWLAFLDSKWNKEHPKEGFSSQRIAALLSMAVYQKTLDEHAQQAGQDVLTLSKLWLHEVVDVSF